MPLIGPGIWIGIATTCGGALIGDKLTFNGEVITYNGVIIKDMAELESIFNNRTASAVLIADDVVSVTGNDVAGTVKITTRPNRGVRVYKKDGDGNIYNYENWHWGTEDDDEDVTKVVCDPDGSTDTVYVEYLI